MQATSLTAPDVVAVDTLIIEHHNATHPEELSLDGWSEDWVLRVLLAPRYVQHSHQEDEALWRFALNTGAGGWNDLAD